jgi:hypothetical protein
MPPSIQQHFATHAVRRAPLAMAEMEKMPNGLDLDFARRTYQRLSGVTA